MLVSYTRRCIELDWLQGGLNGMNTPVPMRVAISQVQIYLNRNSLKGSLKTPLGNIVRNLHAKFYRASLIKKGFKIGGTKYLTTGIKCWFWPDFDFQQHICNVGQIWELLGEWIAIEEKSSNQLWKVPIWTNAVFVHTITKFGAATTLAVVR